MGARSRWSEIAVVTATLSSIAFLVGQGSSQLLASTLFALPEGRPHRTAEPLAARSPRDGCALLEGHPFFDSALELTCDGPEPPPPPLPPGPRGEPGECDPAVRLVGVYVRRGDAEQSFAAIRSAAGASLLYREGMRVEGRSVVAIGESSVLLASEEGVECTVSMFESPGPQLAMLGDGVIPPVVESAGSAAHIEQLGEGRYAIDRAFVNDVIARQAWPIVRAVPDQEDDRIVGMRIFGVRRGSLLGQLGIQNGDSVRTVDGHEIVDTVTAIEAYARLPTAEHVTIGLVRRGQPMTIDYVIR